MRLTRRALIEGIARAGGFGAAFWTMQSMGLLAPASNAAAFEVPRGVGKNTKVVILGAGIAGLVTAYEMGKAGFDCTVLEARERPGGRNWTIRAGTKVEFTDGTTQVGRFEAGNYLNAGPARLPSIHYAMLGYCKELGIPLEVEVNTSRSALLENSKAFGGKPVEMRQVINDARGGVSELLAKAIHRGALDEEITREDRDRMLSFLRTYGDLDALYAYKGSDRAGAQQLPGAGPVAEKLRDPLPLHALLDASVWEGTLFEETLMQQATMFQPVGGMDSIPYAFAAKLGHAVKYNSPVKEIRKTENGVRIVYSDGANGAARMIEAAYCVCCLPLTLLQKTANDFSPRVAAALSEIGYDGAYKIGWESRRFWEQENNIYGGISWFGDGPINMVWYPSAKFFSEKGVVISGYAIENGTPFGDLPTMQAKLDASRAAVERMHPGRGGELANPMYISWGKIPYNLGSWVGYRSATFAERELPYYTQQYKEFIVPDGRIFFAGDHCSHIIGWQEGAALSAQRAVQMILEDMQQR